MPTERVVLVSMRARTGKLRRELKSFMMKHIDTARCVFILLNLLATILNENRC
jgi:hypothetical protein